MAIPHSMIQHHRWAICMKIWRPVHVRLVPTSDHVWWNRNRCSNVPVWMSLGLTHRSRLWSRAFASMTHCACASSITHSSIWIRNTIKFASISCTNKLNGNYLTKKWIVPKRKCWCLPRCRYDTPTYSSLLSAHFCFSKLIRLIALFIAVASEFTKWNSTTGFGYWYV